MGTEAVWIPAVLSAVGAAGTAYSASETAKDQDRAAARGINDQAKRQEQADAAVAQGVGAINKSTPEAERKAATDDFLQQLRRSRGAATDDNSALGGASGAYKIGVHGAANDVDASGKEAASIMGRIAGPLRQRTNEGVGFGRLGSQLGGIGRASNADAFLAQLRQRGVKSNPWIDAGSDIIGGAGSGMASNGYGGTYDPYPEVQPVKTTPRRM